LEGLLERTRRPEKRAEYEAELAVPSLPMALAYLWHAYRRLRRRKGSGFGPGPIEWPDIDAFLRLSGETLAPWEIEVIEELDDAFLTAVTAAQSSSAVPPKD
jgi:hypothetical protein